MISWLPLLVTLALIVNCYGDRCDSITLDSCGNQIYSLLHRPVTTPRNNEDLEIACQTMNDGLKCVKDRLKECPGIISSKIKSRYLRSLPPTIQVVCGNNGTQLGRKLIPYSECLREKLVGFKCPQNFFNAVETALKESDPKEQLFSACCASEEYNRCSYVTIQDACGSKAAKARLALSETLSNFLHRTCRPVVRNKTDKCTAKLSKTVSTKELRKVTNVLVGFNDILINVLGP